MWPFRLFINLLMGGCAQNNTFQIPQFSTEAILRSHLQAQVYLVEMATELVSFKQFDDHVEATIKKTVNGSETTETKSYSWVIGADGGKSTALPCVKYVIILRGYCRRRAQATWALLRGIRCAREMGDGGATASWCRHAGRPACSARWYL